jgi:predicted nucleic acid-binding protein
VAVVVFDADVLIAYLGRDDANHQEAVERIRRAVEERASRWVSAVNYTEILVGPLKAGGPAAAETVDAMFVRLSIETKHVDMALAQRTAAVRWRTRLSLPDAYAVATAIHAEKRGHQDVRLETFDQRVVKAYRDLHPLGF